MKHKLEIWKYTPFEYEEATAHLNEMAAKGWSLRDITTAFLPVACYEKNEAAASYRYTVEIVSELENEDMRILCRDAGWERVLQLEDGLWVFRTKDRDAKPLFADSAQRREIGWENLYNNSARPFYMLLIALICLAAGVALLAGSRDNPQRSWYFIARAYWLVIFGLIVTPMEITNMLWMKRGSFGRGTFGTGAKPGWLKKLTAAGSFLPVIFIAGLLLIRGIQCAAAGDWAGVLRMVLFPAIFLAGAGIYLIGRQKMAGRFLMSLALVGFILEMNNPGEI